VLSLAWVAAEDALRDGDKKGTGHIWKRNESQKCDNASARVIFGIFHVPHDRVWSQVYALGALVQNYLNEWQSVTQHVQGDSVTILPMYDHV
jgi:hypothetical protein